MNTPDLASRINFIKLAEKSPHLASTMWGDFGHFLGSITDTCKHQIGNLLNQLI